MDVSFPFRIDATGRTAAVPDRAAHVRDMIEAVLFTAPGERVNRPDFGSGLQEMLFDANSDALVTAADFLIRSALQQHLGDVVTIESLAVVRDEGTLSVTLVYALVGTGERMTDTFTREV